MDAHQVGELLTRLASEVPKGQAIVEVGCWLGAATAYLALGANVPIHVFDRFRATPQEVEKAALRGVTLKEGENTLPRVRKTLEPFGAEIHWHRGDIRRSRWSGPIGLYVDDASKRPSLWARSARIFLANVAVGGSVVLMDYHYHESAGPAYLAQPRHMEAHRDRFELVADRPGGTTAAVFRRIA